MVNLPSPTNSITFWIGVGHIFIYMMVNAGYLKSSTHPNFYRLKDGYPTVNMCINVEHRRGMHQQNRLQKVDGLVVHIYASLQGTLR